MERKYSLILSISLCLFFMPSSQCMQSNDRQFQLQEVVGAGFHRALKYSVKMRIINDNCSFMIKQQIPVHLYVDIDEIQNLKAFGGPDVVIEPAVDTESPSYNAKEHSLSIFPTNYELQGAVIMLNVLLPVHARYQEPGPSGTKLTISIESGRLYSNCSALFQTADNSKDSCNRDDSIGEECSWTFVYEFTQPKEENAFKLPTGNTNHTIAVTVITLLTASIASLSIVRKALHC